MNQPPTLYRVILQVSDLSEAARFYEQLLGVAGRNIRGGRHYFDCSAVILALVDEGAQAQPIPDYIYFAVADLEATHARAQSLNCLAPEQVHGASAGAIVTRPWGERSFYARDPFGNRLCFVDERTVFTGRS